MKIAPQAIQTKKISKKRTAYMTENPNTKSILVPFFLETACCGLQRVKAGDFSDPLLPTGHLSLWGVADLDSRPPFHGVSASVVPGRAPVGPKRHQRGFPQAAGVPCGPGLGSSMGPRTLDEDPPAERGGLAYARSISP